MTPPSDAKHPDTGQGGIIPQPLRDSVDVARSHLSDAAGTAVDVAGKAVEAAKDGLGQTKDALGSAIAGGRDKASDAIAASRDTAVDAYAFGRGRAGDAYAAARARAKAAAESTSQNLEASPLAAVIGGLVLGIVVGALLPRTERETQALGGVGQKLTELGKEAIGAARTAGEAKLAELGLTSDKARESLHTLIDGAMAAATSAGSAAVDTRRGKPQSEGGDSH